MNILETSLYRKIEKTTIRNFNLRCIDGSIHGCGKCVGYCSYDGHAGFLTPEMRKAHQCLEKRCYYHYPKQAVQGKKHDDSKTYQERLLSIAQAATAAMEGLRVIRATVGPNANCVVYYAAIAEYDVSSATNEIAASTGLRIHMKQIQCDFNVAATLVMA